MSLLDSITRSLAEERPNQIQDICELIDHVMSDLKK